MVAGTYLHGIFDSEDFINLFIKSLKESNDIIISEEAIIEKVNEYKDNEYDKLSKLFEENIDIDKTYGNNKNLKLGVELNVNSY